MPQSTVRAIFPFVLALSAATFGQTNDYLPTLPELVRRNAPQPVLQARTRELFPKSVEQILPQADLVVYGTVGQIDTYLSADQKALYSDCVINPIRVVLPQSIATVARPGQVPQIVVNRWGGQTTIDGVSVAVVDDNLPSFHTGEEVFLILRYDSGDRKYHLSNDELSGAFFVIGNQIQPLVAHHVYERFRGMTVAQMESEIHRLHP
jgi:hypothetical protein